MITHNLNLPDKFNKIIYLENGVMSGCGDFENLIRSNNNFRNLQDSFKLKDS